MYKELTPAMRQYLDIKGLHKDAILFFRMGDFYEMFFDDAVLASGILDIALTSRDREKKIPMCGVPYHAASSYIARLIKAGHKVAVCEQMDDQPVQGRIVERAVTRVITPGIAFEDELLDKGSNNFISSVFAASGKYGLASMDVSTGEFMATELAANAELRDEISRLRPIELVLPEGQAIPAGGPDWPVRKITRLPSFDFSMHKASVRLLSHFNAASLDGFGLTGLDAAIPAAGALLNYIKETQKSPLAHVRKCSPYFSRDYMHIDDASRRNLEIVRNMPSGAAEGTLLGLLDRTKTAMGARLLKSFLLRPLKDAPAINRRLDAVAEIAGDRATRKRLATLMGMVYDLERLAGRLSAGLSSPRDMAMLKSSLEIAPEIKSILTRFVSPVLSEAASCLDPVHEAVDMLREAIVDSPPASIKDGGVIRNGFSSTLDELRRVGSGGKEWLARLEASERSRTGISSLKVGYNRVFGYYISVTKANLRDIPEDYIRKQTLVNAERFITAELKEWEEKILTAGEKARALEAGLYSELLNGVCAYTGRIQKTAGVLSLIDVIASFADVSDEPGYTRPEVTESDEIVIVNGRHPVIDAAMRGDFVPNDLRLDCGGNRLLLITGPNMAGKSTYLRQSALIVLMAQTGCFVPAEKAAIGVVDRIFTRVGASDDLAGGRSTFMVEMSETANILNNATSRSLIILDEIGRGTSTFDGLSIAWAVAEHLHDSPALRTKTIFATHYHELTELTLTKESVKNYNMAVKEHDGKIVFLRKVLPGGASRSYGIHVAELAGLPREVIVRAGEILKNLEQGELNEAGMPRLAQKAGAAVTRKDGGGKEAEQTGLPGERDPVRDELRRIVIERTTPLEALGALERMKEMIKS